jgi:hypothetical protein
MIVCHEKKIIFVKTKKVGGTSFEIALSEFCGPECIITPVTPQDEDLRKSLGYRGAQNFTIGASNGNNQVDFFNHMPSAHIRKNLPFNIWMNYKKITIVRNPYEVLVSKYFWRREQRDFKDFVMSGDAGINENELIAPIFGEHKLDVYLKYETMQSDLRKFDLDYLIDGMSKLNAKGNIRPKSADVASIFGRYPGLVEYVEEKCHNILKSFSYPKPVSL